MPATDSIGVMSAGRLVMASVFLGVLPGSVTVKVADALAVPPLPVQVSA
jgi:hypothetical protein